MVPSGQMLCDFHIDLFTKVKEVVKSCNDSTVFFFSPDKSIFIKMPFYLGDFKFLHQHLQ